MVGQRELIAAFAGVDVEDVRGMRAPFLAVSITKGMSFTFEYRFPKLEVIYEI